MSWILSLKSKGKYHRGLGLYLTYLILVFAVPQVIAIGATIAIVTIPVGMILGFCSVIVLCRSLVSSASTEDESSDDNPRIG